MLEVYRLEDECHSKKRYPIPKPPRLIASGMYGSTQFVCKGEEDKQCHDYVVKYMPREGNSRVKAEESELSFHREVQANVICNRVDPEMKYHVPLIEASICDDQFAMVFKYGGSMTLFRAIHSETSAITFKIFYQFIVDYYNLQLGFIHYLGDNPYEKTEHIPKTIPQDEWPKHKRGILIHNDIHQKNILYDANTKKLVLIDWGRATLAFDDENESWSNDANFLDTLALALTRASQDPNTRKFYPPILTRKEYETCADKIHQLETILRTTLGIFAKRMLSEDITQPSTFRRKLPSLPPILPITTTVLSSTSSSSDE